MPPSRIDHLIQPFIRDAETNGGVRLRAEPSPDDKYPGVLVREPRGSGTRVYIDAYGDPRDDAQTIDFNSLQELVIFHRAEVLGIFGPWPPCPADGHGHKLVVTKKPHDGEALWWACPTSGRISPVGQLHADPAFVQESAVEHDI